MVDTYIMGGAVFKKKERKKETNWQLVREGYVTREDRTAICCGALDIRSNFMTVNRT